MCYPIFGITADRRHTSIERAPCANPNPGSPRHTSLLLLHIEHTMWAIAKLGSPCLAQKIGRLSRSLRQVSALSRHKELWSFGEFGTLADPKKQRNLNSATVKITYPSLFSWSVKFWLQWYLASCGALRQNMLFWPTL